MTPESHAPPSPRSAPSGQGPEVADAFGAAHPGERQAAADGAAASTVAGDAVVTPLRADLPDSSPPSSAVTDGDASPAGGPQGPVPNPNRSRYSMGSLPNMLRSMFVIGLLVLALVAVIPRIGQVDRPAIDAAAKASQTASQTKWPIELPKGLAKGWTPTVATYAPGTGKVPTFTTVWTTPGGSDIALKQAEAVTDEWLNRSVDGGSRSGSATVAGRAFERFNDSSRAQVSYVVRGTGANGLTLVATTTGSESELKTFVAALEKVTPSSG